MYPARPVDSECEVYDRFYEKANNRYCQGLFKPDEPIEVCRLEEIPENLGGFYGEVKIFDDVIYLHQESEFQIQAKLKIAYDINNSFKKQFSGSFLSDRVVAILNRYSGGSIYYKYSDFNILKRPNYEDVVLVGQIIFRHETEEQFLLESIHYLTEYTSVKCVIIFQFPNLNRDGIRIRVIIFQKELNFDLNKKNLLKSALMKGEKKLNEGIKIDCPMTILDWKRDKSYLALFNVKQMDVIEYTNDDFKCEKPLEFEIPGSVFDHHEPILTRIQFNTIKELKKKWENFTNVY
ncbi:unnamed protein product [Brachionus calyciflorus]|uniref:Uncharacterized protein n=1 Tax=Brachionus calyciflorus TaxID=104777 RepID=A0A814DS90_9BILA|nr:unnamed protein product [Brachionus calyciflorus]